MGFYTYDGPAVGPGAYYGRELILRSLVDGTQNGRSFALCGGPRTGRTSTLKHIVEIVRQQWIRRPQDSKVVPVYFDLATHAQRGVRTLVPALWQSVTDAIRHPDVHGEAVPPKLPKPDFRRAKDIWLPFNESATTLWNDMRGSGAWCRYVLLFDNADLLFAGPLDNVREAIADLGRVDAEWSPAALVLTGSRYLRESLLDEETPFKYLRPLFLGCLKDSEATALIRAGIKDISDASATQLLQASGKHPYVLQRLLAELEGHGADALDAAIGAAEPDLRELFERLWGEFDMARGVTYRGAYAAPEHALMQLLIDLGTGCDLKTAERELGIRPLREYAEFLEYAAAAERALRSDAVHLIPQFDLWNAWYSERILE